MEHVMVYSPRDADRIVRHLTWMLKMLRYHKQIDESQSYDSEDMMDAMDLLHKLTGSPLCSKCLSPIVPKITGAQIEDGEETYYICEACGMESQGETLFGMEDNDNGE